MQKSDCNCRCNRGRLGRQPSESTAALLAVFGSKARLAGQPLGHPAELVPAAVAIGACRRRVEHFDVSVERIGGGEKGSTPAACWKVPGVASNVIKAEERSGHE
jgi:hypothetical protein